jgi:molybdenum cofactor guanylyltransferase
MTSKLHNKHAVLTRPSLGKYGRNEWAIIGTHCSSIKNLSGRIIAALSASYQCAYVDAIHAEEESSEPEKLTQGAALEVVQHSAYTQLNATGSFNSFTNRQLLAGADCILLNGNHHEGGAQVVVIDETKKESLRKRIHQLTNLQLILLASAEVEVFDFIQGIPSFQQVPQLLLSDTEGVIEFFSEQMKAAMPLMYGLVLAGGKSTRMGEDKSMMKWHGKEQQYYVADMLKGYCDQVFISCREDQKASVDESYGLLPDTFVELGPYGAILSAFRERPNVAWLVVACDLPLVDNQTIEQLISNRKTASIATTFNSPYDGMPEPLITIWEPKSYPALLSFLAQGYSCPRKVLMNSRVSIISPENEAALLNVNTPEDAAKLKALLLQKPNPFA